jgi:hypothetical protein
MNDKKFLKKMTRKDYENILPKLETIIRTLVVVGTTLSSTFRDVKAGLKKQFNYDRDSEIDKLLSRTQEEAKAARNKYDKKRQAKNASRGDDDMKYNIKEVYDAIDKFIVSPDAWERIAGVMLCTGSRSIEVMRVSDYKDGEGNNMIKVIGVAKREEGNDIKFRKPVLRATIKQVLDSVAFIREWLKDKYKNNKSVLDDNKKLTSNLNNTLNRRIDTQFDDENNKRKVKTTSHTLRYIYANVTYQLHGQKDRVPESQWIYRVLHHKTETTSLVYLGIWVDGIEFTVPIPDEVRLKIGVLENDSVAIKQEQKEIKDEIKVIQADLDEPDLQEYRNVNRSADENVKKAKLLKLYNKLIELDIRPTNAKLRSFGFGSRLVNEFFKNRRG